MISVELINHVEESHRDAKFGYFYFGAFKISNIESIKELIRFILETLQNSNFENNFIVFHNSCAIETNNKYFGLSISIYDKDLRLDYNNNTVKIIFRFTVIIEERFNINIYNNKRLYFQQIIDEICKDKRLISPNFNSRE